MQNFVLTPFPNSLKKPEELFDLIFSKISSEGGKFLRIIEIALFLIFLILSLSGQNYWIFLAPETLELILKLIGLLCLFRPMMINKVFLTEIWLYTSSNIRRMNFSYSEEKNKKYWSVCIIGRTGRWKRPAGVSGTKSSASVSVCSAAKS